MMLAIPYLDFNKINILVSNADRKIWTSLIKTQLACYFNFFSTCVYFAIAKEEIEKELLKRLIRLA